jgi:hypothetical protein
MALATLHLAAIPVLAGLVAGTGAVATYVASPTAPTIAVVAAPDCSAQTWPYVDRACVANASAPEDRTVRLVAAPRANGAFEARWSEVPEQPMSRPSAAAPAGLTTSDGVLRQPQHPEAIPNAPAAAPPKAKRSDVKREKRARVTAQSYQVPAERSSETRQVVVVRPLRLDLFR